MNTDSLKEFQKRVQAIKKYQERLGKINIESLEANDEVYEVLEKITEVLKSNIDNEEKVRKMQDIINDEQRFVGFYAYQLTLEGLVLMRLISVMHVELETRYSEYIIKNNLNECLKGIEKSAIAA